MADIKAYTRNSKGEPRRTRFNSIWGNMKNRCNNEVDPNYHRYGDRGITVCDKWATFDGFVDDMYLSYIDAVRRYGENEVSIDRIDNDLGYSYENCRWATKKTQANNRRSNRLIEFNGEVKTLAQWSEITGIKRTTIGMRLDTYGWGVDKSLTTH